MNTDLAFIGLLAPVLILLVVAAIVLGLITLVSVILDILTGRK